MKECFRKLACFVLGFSFFFFLTSTVVCQCVSIHFFYSILFFLSDPYLHAAFRERGGVDVVCSIIQQAIKKPTDDEESQVCFMIIMLFSFFFKLDNFQCCTKIDCKSLTV